MKHDIDQIRASISVPQLLRRLGVDCPDGKRMINAPHREEKTPSCSIFDEGRRWKDFGSGDGGTVIDLLMVMRDMTEGDAIAELAKMTGIEGVDNDIDGMPLTKIPKPPERSSTTGSELVSIEKLRSMRINLKHHLEQHPHCSAAQALSWIPDEHLTKVLRRGWLGSESDGTLVYLYRRGWKARTQPYKSRGDRWRSGKAKDNMFVSFRDSDIHDQHKKKLLMCEGESDTIAAFIELGKTHRVAGCLSCSIMPPMEIVYPLIRGVEEITIAFDGDIAGRAGAQKLRAYLASRCNTPIKISNLPDGSDLKSLYLSKLLKKNKQTINSK